MKKLLFFFMFTLSICTLPAQDYISLVQEQATWVIWQWCGISLDCCDLFGYRIEGDTMIDGTAYKKVHRLEFFIDQYPFNPYRKSGQVLFGAIREDLDERKVYARIFENSYVGWYCTDPGPEKLWYDFSLEVGDTLPSCINVWAGPVYSIDTAALFGEDRRRWRVIGEALYAYQVEGLGTHTGLFDPDFGWPQSGESSYTLEHYCIGPEADCGIVDATSVRELPLPASAISIEPNPAAGSVTIRLTGEEGRIEQIALYGLSGQLLREWQGNGSGLQEIDAGHLPGGVYMLRVRSSEKAGWGRLVIAR